MRSRQANRGYIARGVLYGVFSCIVLIVISYLVMLWLELPFPPFRLFDFVAQNLARCCDHMGDRLDGQCDHSRTDRTNFEYG